MWYLLTDRGVCGRRFIKNWPKEIGTMSIFYASFFLTVSGILCTRIITMAFTPVKQASYNANSHSPKISQLDSNSEVPLTVELSNKLKFNE